ncbi:glutamate--tRNA ligase [soil metagenome]
MSLRVRFAPSPTGYLHVGGARTALFNWFLARDAGGVFMLRIEDTDQARSSEAHTQAILDGMRWLGMDWDEGPVFQSEGVDRHRADALRLLAEGKAYRDFTDPAALASLRESDPDRVIRFPREAADALGADEAEARAASGEPHAIRFRVPAGETVWKDRVHGAMRFRNEGIEDLVILRSGGTPTYNLAVVSDDADGRITLVIRGDDHLSNTPKQILLHEALGNPVPEFAHVPMILGSDGKRLSKRHGATAVGDYRSQGILPEAMVNFLALLGWNPGTEEEVFSAEELCGRFALDRVQKKSAVFDPARLEWLNGRHLAAAPVERVAAEVRALMGALPPDEEARVSAGGGAWFRALIDLLKMRARTVTEIAQVASIYTGDEPLLDADAAAKHWFREPAVALGHLEALGTALAGLDAWKDEPLEATVRGVAEARGVGAGKLIHPLRVALTGQAASPGIFEVMVVLGRERCLHRIGAAAERVRPEIPRS